MPSFSSKGLFDLLVDVCVPIEVAKYVLYMHIPVLLFKKIGKFMINLGFLA